MFTGIVAAVGKITSVTPLVGGSFAGVRLAVDAGPLPLADVALGDSIAINGACMTVVEKDGRSFSVDVSRESLNKTAGLDAVGEVNLEKALTLAERLGGHLVSGHVDGLGTVHSFEPVGESRELVIDAPWELARFLAYKGSVVVNGVSLTVNRVEDVEDVEGGTAGGKVCRFSINLIPHTIEVTTLKHLHAGSRVNLEIDLIARYVERMLSVQAQG
ncbi:riboflavin synthase [Massilia sp. MS-15]|uniref:riboflavin synthase n=1 Tax=Massilia sp. MS-15 TaxID=2878200 RepID=UPI001CD62C30|nr:riboflavin synthase [Massilia sp. MS-15]MCA1248394.1 riboflavin synthase [Massilia sp. MS-15]